MNMKKLMAGAVASAMALSTMAVAANAATTTAEGTAFIMFSSGDWNAQWWDDGNEYATKATNVAITGNGQYTVAVEAYAVYEDDAGVEEEVAGTTGVAFMAVGVNNGENLFPGMIITIDSVSIDGTAVTLNGTPYTSSDDGVVTRVNLYNEWVSALPDDARTVKGTQEAGTIDADATPTALNVADIGEWNKISVTFTVSGIEGGDAATDGDNANEDNTDNTPAAGTGNTNTATNDKQNADTGIEGVAVVAGLAIVAAGAVVVAKKRK